MTQASVNIAQQFKNGGVVPADLVGQDAVSKTYVNDELAKRDAAIQANATTASGINAKVDTHIADTSVHVTPAEKETYNGHIANTNIHVTTTDKNNWNSKAPGSVQTDLQQHVGNTDIHTSLSEKTKLAGIQTGAEVNQNAFSKVNDVNATGKTDTLTLSGGTGITVSTNPSSKIVTITATGQATPGPHALSHITGGTDVIPDAVIGGNSGLMSGVDAQFVRVDGETKAGAQAKVDALAGEGNTKTVKQVDDKVTAHLADYVMHPADGGTTGGTATAYTASSTPNPSVLVDKIGIVITAHLDSGANPTLKWGTLTAYPMLKANGSPATIKKDGIYTWRFNAAKSAFILQGEGSEERTGNVTGQSISRSDTTLRIRPQEGYYPGDVNNSVQFSDPNWIPENIMAGKSVFGLLGTLKSSKFAEGSGTRVKDVPLTVNNLSFTPLLVVYTAYGMIGSSPFAETTVAASDSFFYGNYSTNTKTPSIRSNISSSGSFYNSAAAEISLTANGFSKTGGVPFDTGAAYSWRAFG